LVEPGDKRTGTFPRAARLTRPAEFGRVFGGATRIADRYFTILIRDSKYPWPRLGMAVSKKTAPKAVARNRIKRVVRDEFRRHCQTLGAVDAVVIAKPPARNARRAELHRSLNRLWQRVSEQCEPS
jgi:ribonuclease P protein component